MSSFPQHKCSGTVDPRFSGSKAGAAMAMQRMTVAAQRCGTYGKDSCPTGSLAHSLEIQTRKLTADVRSPSMSPSSNHSASSK